MNMYNLKQHDIYYLRNGNYDSDYYIVEITMYRKVLGYITVEMDISHEHYGKIYLDDGNGNTFHIGTYLNAINVSFKTIHRHIHKYIDRWCEEHSFFAPEWQVEHLEQQLAALPMHETPKHPKLSKVLKFIPSLIGMVASIGGVFV